MGGCKGLVSAKTMKRNCIVYTLPTMRPCGEINQMQPLLPEKNSHSRATGICMCSTSSYIFSFYLCLTAITLRTQHGSTYKAQCWCSAFITTWLWTPLETKQTNLVNILKYLLICYILPYRKCQPLYIYGLDSRLYLLCTEGHQKRTFCHLSCCSPFISPKYCSQQTRDPQE